MFELEKPYRIVAEAGKTIIKFTPAVETMVVERWQCPPGFPSPSQLTDAKVTPPATYKTAARCDLYTKENWDAMIIDVYGGSEALYFATHNAVEVNGNILDVRDGQ